MTEKQMLKYVGKNVKIVKHTFHHSVALETLEGKVLEPVEVFTHILRWDKLTTKKHLDFYVETEDNKAVSICWNELKLIKSIEVIEDEENK